MTSSTVHERLRELRHARLHRERVEIEGLEDELYVRELTAGEVERLSRAADPDGEDATMAQSVAPWVVAALVDADGVEVFEADDAAEVVELLGVRELRRIMDAITSANALDATPIAAKND